MLPMSSQRRAALSCYASCALCVHRCQKSRNRAVTHHGINMPTSLHENAHKNGEQAARTQTNCRIQYEARQRTICTHLSGTLYHRTPAPHPRQPWQPHMLAHLAAKPSVTRTSHLPCTGISYLNSCTTCICAQTPVVCHKPLLTSLDNVPRDT